VEVTEEEDGMIVHGRGEPAPGGGRVETHLDHRIAMCFAVMGMASAHSVEIDDAAPIATSFPDFIPMMSNLGAKLTRMNR
ncbi:MAG: 3-phosphoshikimate 1-carboxyvinyltransferase, partial [Pseudomonadota bacterium]